MTIGLGGSQVTGGETPAGGSGDVVGAASATDNALTRFDGTTGKLIQNSNAILADNGDITFQSTDVGAAAAPNLILYRDSASPATNDVLGQLSFQGRDSGAGVQEYANINTVIVDPTAASEDANLQFNTVVAGTLRKRMTIGEAPNDSPAAYNDSGSNKGLLCAEHFIINTSDNALANSAAEQKAFNGSANGALTLPTGRYFFESLIYITTMSATSGNCAFDILGAGTATIGAALYSNYGVDSTTPTTLAAVNGAIVVNAQTNASMQTAGTGTGLFSRLEGTFTITATGTIIPSVTLVTAAAGVLLKAGSYFRCWRVGGTGVQNVGNWS